MSDPLVNRTGPGRLVTTGLTDLAHRLTITHPGTWEVHHTPTTPPMTAVVTPDGYELTGWTPDTVWTAYLAAVQPAHLIPLLARLEHLEAENRDLRRGQGRYPKDPT